MQFCRKPRSLSDPSFLPGTSRPVLSAPSTAARDPHEAIARASQETGADFNYLLAQARLESGLNPAAKARTSSASGLYQFIDSTWLETLDRHGAGLGFGSAADAIQSVGGKARVTDGSVRQEIMALRFDPAASALMAGALANDNSAVLSGVLGREPDAAELYMAHFLGAGGATKFLRQLASNPDVVAASILPAPAAANRTIFYKPGGAQRSVGEVMDLMRSKMARAMNQPLPQPMPSPAPYGPGFSLQIASADTTRENAPFIAPIGQFAPPPIRPGRPADSLMQVQQTSMADRLKSSFVLVESAAPPRALEHMQTAYARLKAFDL